MSRRIDPFSLKLLAGAAREGSIARAAAREHIAASAMSRRLAELERVLGVALLVRSPHGIALTEAGRVACERAARIDEEMRALMHDVHARDLEVRGVVRLFANASSIVGFLPERLRDFAGRWPGVDVQLHERLSGEVLRACLDGSADVGILSLAQTPAGVECWDFADDPLMVVMPVGHGLATLRAVTFAQVLDYRLIGMQPGGALDQFLHERAAAVQRRLDVSVSVSSFDAACRMVEVGLGVAILPTSAASAFAGARRFVRRALDEAWSSRRLRLIALPRHPRPRSVEALIEAIRALAVVDRPVDAHGEGHRRTR